MKAEFFSPWNSYSCSSLQMFYLHPFDIILFSPTKSILDWENPIIPKMLDWKIQTAKTSVKIIQYDTIGRVLDCFNTSEEGGLDFQSKIFGVFWSAFQYSRVINTKQCSKMLSWFELISLSHFFVKLLVCHVCTSLVQTFRSFLMPFNISNMSVYCIEF